MTAAELDEVIAAGRKRAERRARSDELLAFNIGALVLTAFNAPGRYPKTPESAFGRKPAAPADGGRRDFAEIARQLNARLGGKA
ncbi:MAG: hypothetical protein IK093_05815 [Ruminiclostridium sp.]|nr:hypothetical protein [Ruminiclostridium sp.]